MNEARLLKTLRNDFPTFLIDPNDYKKEKLIGKGGYAEVWLAINKKTGEQVALKQLYHTITFKQARSFAREIKTMSYGNHPFFLKFLGFSATSPLVLISEYMPNRSLFHFLKSNHRRIKLKGTHRTLIAMGISHAMWYLHSLGIIHRDLKSMNILLSEDYLPRLCDFGIARFLSNNPEDIMTTRIGTPHWMAPEILSDQKYGFPADVYSYSMLLYEMFTNSIPWAGKDPATILKLACNDHSRPKFPIEDDDDDEDNIKSEKIKKSKISIKQLIQLCWAQSPDDRPTFHKIYHMFKTKQVFFDGTNLKKVDELDKMLSSFMSKVKSENSNKNQVQNPNQTNFDEDDSDDDKFASISTTSALTTTATITNTKNEFDDESSYSYDKAGYDDDYDSFLVDKNPIISRQKSRNIPIKASKLKAMTVEVVYDDSTKSTNDTSSQIIKQDSKSGQSSKKLQTIDKQNYQNGDYSQKKVSRRHSINFANLKNIDDFPTFSNELKKISTIISIDQLKTFFSSINEYFDLEVDEEVMKIILKTIQSILSKKIIENADNSIDSKSEAIEYQNKVIDCIIQYDIQQKMCFKLSSLMSVSLEILLILFKNRPTAFQSDFEKQMTYIIKKFPNKAITLLASFSNSYLSSAAQKKSSKHSYLNSWTLLDLLIKRSRDFFNANLGQELISILYNLCSRSNEYKEKKLESCIGVFQKGTQLDIVQDDTISMAYVCLSHFSFEFEDIEFDITNLTYILKSAKKASTIRVILYLLLKLKRIPRKEKKNLIQVLLDRSRTFSEATLCLIRICSKEDGAFILMQDISWISMALPTLKDTLSLFLTVFYQVENRKFLLKSKHTSNLFNNLLFSMLPQNDNKEVNSNGEILTTISVIFNSFGNLPIELFDLFTRRGVFKSIVDATIHDKNDPASIKASLDILTCCSNEKFNDEFLRLFDIFSKKISKWPKIIPIVLQAFTLVSKYQQCANKIKTIKIDKLILDNYGSDSKYYKLASKLMSSLR